MAASLTKKERIIRQATGQEVDRIPSIGGWMLGVRNLAQIAGLTVEQFLSNPLNGTIQANLALDCDGMVSPVVPDSLSQVRTGHILEETFPDIPPEALVEKANSYPDSEKEILAAFNYAAEEAHYRSYFETAFRDWQGIEPIPNFWEIGGHFALYSEFGYSAFLMACALYPDAVGKIYWAKSLHSRERAKILTQLYKDYHLVPLMFCGEDVCNNKGAMVSPKFLRKHYFPTVQMIIEPLVDAGVRLIHHCDGEVRPVLPDFLEIGFSGLQGFQYELGIEIPELRQLRSRKGEQLLFFTGLSVSRTLPFGSPQDVIDEVDYFIDSTEGGQGMFLFTSNVTGVEVPPENIVAAYRRVKEGKKRTQNWKSWPWAITHNPTLAV